MDINKATAFQSNYIASKWLYLKQHRAFKEAPVKTVMRVLVWAIHCLFKVPAVIKIPQWDCKFYLPPKFRKAGSSGIYILREKYESPLTYLDLFLKPDQVFIDGGANFGIYTVAASKIVGDNGSVLSFEPSIESFPILERNVKINQFDNVILFKSALSSEEGTSRLYHIDNAPNSYSLNSDSRSDTTSEEVKTETLDGILNHHKIKQVDFIKLDVEGAEEEVLKGANSLLRKSKPKVLFEMGSRNSSNAAGDTQGAWNYLKQLGYCFFMIQSDGELFKLTSAPPAGNILAIAEHADK